MNFKQIKNQSTVCCTHTHTLNLISYIFIMMDEERFKIIDAITFK